MSRRYRTGKMLLSRGILIVFAFRSVLRPPPFAGRDTSETAVAEAAASKAFDRTSIPAGLQAIGSNFRFPFWSEGRLEACDGYGSRGTKSIPMAGLGQTVKFAYQIIELHSKRKLTNRSDDRREYGRAKLLLGRCRGCVFCRGSNCRTVPANC